jgi:trans-aconitate methyltransferase
MAADRWNAQEYALHSLNQKKWGSELIEKLSPRDGECVLDIGSGDGLLTSKIAQYLPHGLAVGLDSSPGMVRQAVDAFPSPRFPNLCFILGDASLLPFTGVFNAVFSNATLHWVLDQRPVVESAARALKTGGRLLFQMGGRGNAEGVVKAAGQLLNLTEWKPYFRSFKFPYGFFSPEEYRGWIVGAGLLPLRVELIQKDAVFDGDSPFHSWIRTTWLRYTSRVPEPKREEFIKALADTYIKDNPPGPRGTVMVKMVRLEVEARRPG